MPLKIRWTSREYLPYALMLFGGCGLFQIFFIFYAQYFLRIGNYVIIILIPIGISLALFFATIIIFEAFAQVKRTEKLRSQFKKARDYSTTLKAFYRHEVVRPLLIIFAIFTPLFFISYYISLIFTDNQISFLIAEDLSAIICLLVANYFEKNYAKVRRF
jgi:hypothetical protein